MITVGIADLNIAKAPERLVTYALGSCVGICLYDSDRRIAGLAHIMLPWSKEAAAAGGAKNGSSGVAAEYRFADTGITELIRLMCAAGARKHALTAKIAGGAKMFSFNSSVFNIGERNVEAVRRVLAAYEIPIIAEDTGKDYGRTIFFSAEDGSLEIRAASKPVLKI